MPHGKHTGRERKERGKVTKILIAVYGITTEREADVRMPKVRVMEECAV